MEQISAYKLIKIKIFKSLGIDKQLPIWETKPKAIEMKMFYPSFYEDFDTYIVMSLGRTAMLCFS